MVHRLSRIKPGQVSNEILYGLDWVPDAPRGRARHTVKERLLNGWQAKPGGVTFKVHLDGYNQLPYLEGKQPKSTGACHQGRSV
jgi:hypothetical protein